MRDWINFYLRPSGSKEASWTYELAELHDDALAWLKQNAQKSTRVKIINSGQSISTSHLMKLGASTFAHLQVKFRSSRDAVLFKMYFSDFLIDKPKSINTVLLALIKRTVVSSIVRDIVGVQPMTGKVGSIFNLARPKP